MHWGPLIIALVAGSEGVAPESWTFVDVSDSAGVAFAHAYPQVLGRIPSMSGGVAAGDYDNDGWVDLYLAGGSNPDVLLRNQGDGTFAERTAEAGLTLEPRLSNGPTFADLDGDGWLDLVIGSMAEVPLQVFRNLGPDAGGEVTFEDVSWKSMVPIFRYSFGAAFADFDLDGDLDFFLPQWNSDPTEPLWRNDGDFSFSSASSALVGEAQEALLFSFTPVFTDLNRDGWLDLVVSSDFGNSQVLLNEGGGSSAEVDFRLVTDPEVVVDENGMGAAVGDYDNDGHLDWFVSSIWHPETHPVGNRLYRGRGDGTFEDVTIAAGVLEGHWGWGSCFADFDNDGFLDLFHVNGWSEGFADDLSRLFMNAGDGTFVESSAARGIVDPRQGRGIVCFDYDRDGDIDLFIANNSGVMRLYRNDGGNARASITIRLQGAAPNPQGIGARIEVSAGGLHLTREMHNGSNYVSQNPAEAYFGLGAASFADAIQITWPGGRKSSLSHVLGHQELTVDHSLINRNGFESGNMNGWWGTE